MGIEVRHNAAARRFEAAVDKLLARCDYRMDSTGTIYMLEINPNCGIFYPPSDPGSADFCLLNDSINHKKFMKMIIRTAFKRRDASRMKEKVEEKEMAYA